MKELFEYLDVYNILPWVEFDMTIVRGLSYYTGIVFESYFRKVMTTRSICGGGRYDNLLDKFGYCESVPAIGFGMGDVVIMEGLKELGLLPKLTTATPYCVIPMNKEMKYVAVGVSERLRNSGIPNILYTGKLKLRLAFGYASKIGSKYAILIAPREFRKGNIVLKDLRSGDKNNRIQKEVPLQEFINSLS